MREFGKRVAQTVMAGVISVVLSTSAFAGSGMQIIRDEEIEHDLRVFTAAIFDQAGLSSQSVRFYLVQDDELNAFVAGGQNIFLNTGLILKTDNPDELIGVIAHETGHIADGHIFRTAETMREASIETIFANVLAVAAAVGARSSEAGIAVSTAGQTMAMRNYLRHARTHEASADEAGVRFLKGAHLPVAGFLSFMQKLASQELLPESQQSQYVLTHPLSRDRVDFLANVVATASQPRVPEEWNAQHQRMKAKLLGYLYPDRALAQRGNTPDMVYAHAIANYRKGKADVALSMLETLIKASPHDAYYQELKGQILFENGRIREALAPYSLAVQYAPKAGLIRMAYGHALLELPELQKKNLEEAVKQFRLSLNVEPHTPMTHHFLAIAYGKLGEEGLSRLHLAEEALLEAKLDNAKREANLALKGLLKNASARLQAEDILAEIEKREKKKD